MEYEIFRKQLWEFSGILTLKTFLVPALPPHFDVILN